MKIFNIRVYGILINKRNQLLVSDENVLGKRITKFPGGGLEFGEGLSDCLKREFIEETNREIKIVKHFYTTDFFQLSAFNNNHQIISVYYIVKIIGNTDFDFPISSENQEQKFRWIDLKVINAKDFSLPIDKKVATMLANEAIS